MTMIDDIPGIPADNNTPVGAYLRNLKLPEGPPPDLTAGETEEQLIARAEATKGCGNLITSYHAKKAALANAVERLNGDYGDSLTDRFKVARAAKVAEAERNLNTVLDQIRSKLKPKMADPDEHADVSNPIVLAAIQLIHDIAENPALATLDGMLAYAIPEIYDNVFTIDEQPFRLVPGVPNAVERMTHIGTLSEMVANALDGRKWANVVGTAIELLREEEDRTVKVTVGAVLKNWNVLRSSRRLYEHLRTQETAVFREDLMPMVIDGVPTIMDRKTGAMVDDTDGAIVLYPPITANSSGESRALDEFVAHHFKTPDEVHGFYTNCGISIFGYGIPNLVYLHGNGGSGKDSLMTLMREAVGESMAVSLNSQALTGDEEANDLARLHGARFAYCAMEAEHSRDGGLKGQILKTITSGGMTPLSIRPKYARSSLSVTYRGSVWLYGNHAPRLSSGGDTGLDRRLIVMPITEALDTAARPPSGFSSWEDAVKACAPVFAHRCMEAYVAWSDKRVGYSDARLRMPKSWLQATEEAVLGGSTLGFLRELFMHNTMQPLPTTAVFEVLDLVFETVKAGGASRANYIHTLENVLGISVRFDDGSFVSRDYGDHECLPITVNPQALEKLLNMNRMALARQILTRVGWNEAVANHAADIQRTANSRFK